MPTGPSTHAGGLSDAECSTSKSTKIAITFTEISPDLSPPSPPFEFPKEVLVKILRHLPFPDLYGSVQYVNKLWSYIVRQHVLSSKVWLDTITGTDYIALLHTCSGSLQDPEIQTGSKTSVVSWDGVYVNLELLEQTEVDTYTTRSTPLCLLCIVLSLQD